MKPMKLSLYVTFASLIKNVKFTLHFFDKKYLHNKRKKNRRKL